MISALDFGCHVVDVQGTGTARVVKAELDPSCCVVHKACPQEQGIRLPARSADFAVKLLRAES